MYVDVVFAMFVKPVVNPAFVADCHLTIVPVFPLIVKVVELVPVQTGDVPVVIAIDPPTLAGLTLMIALDEKVESHTPDFTIAL